MNTLTHISPFCILSFAYFGKRLRLMRMFINPYFVSNLSFPFERMIEPLLIEDLAASFPKAP